MTKLSLYNVQQNQSIELAEGSTVQIGRGFEGITDKRVSRKHGEISVQNKSIKIKACHVNPIFYQKNGSDQNYVLHKDSDVTLTNLDKFSLLPNELVYEVRVVDDAPEGEDAAHVASTTSDITDINDHLKNAVNIGSSSNTQQTNNLPSTSTGQSNRKRLLEENDHDEEQNKKLKDTETNESNGAVNSVDTTVVAIKPDPDAQPSTTTAAPIPVDTSKIKPDPDTVKVKTEPNSSPANAVASSSNVKTEPDSTVRARTPEAPHLRSSCDFGVGCYRTTGEHRCKLAHPSDVDYRRPYFPPAPTEAPFCPYGASCYRRNPDHFIQMQHPPSTLYTPQPVGVRPVIPLVVVAPQPQPAVNNEDDEDEEEDDALFLDLSQQDEDLDDSDADRDFVPDAVESEEEEVSDEENNLEE